MITDILEVLGLLGQVSIGVVMIVLARLSQKLGHVTHARQHHIWLYVSALLMWIGVIIQFVLLVQGIDGKSQLQQDVLWVLLIKGLPALGITIAVVVAWHYWSWLLAERD